MTAKNGPQDGFLQSQFLIALGGDLDVVGADEDRAQVTSGGGRWPQ